MEFKAYITNLGLYTEGELSGEWIDFPITEDELEEVKKSIGIDETHEEYFFTDYSGAFADMGLGEYESIDHLNELAEALQDKTDEEIAVIIYAYSERGDTDIRKSMESVENGTIIYPAPNCDSGSDEDLGYSYINELYGSLEIGNTVDEDFVRVHFDYDAFVRDYNINAEPDEEIDDFDELGLSLAELGSDEIEMYFDYDGFGRDLRIGDSFEWVPDAEVWVSLGSSNSYKESNAADDRTRFYEGVFREANLEKDKWSIIYKEPGKEKGVCYSSEKELMTMPAKQLTDLFNFIQSIVLKRTK